MRTSLVLGQGEGRVDSYMGDPSYSLLLMPMFCAEERFIEEFRKVKPRLQQIVCFAASYMLSEFNCPLVITHVFRTQEQQDEIYKNDPKYQSKPFPSVHQDWRGVDARLHDIGVAKANQLATVVNNYFPYRKDTDLKTCLVHDVGQGNHIHFQVSW